MGKNNKKEFNILSGKGLIGFIKANLKNPTDENVLKVVQAIAKPDADQEHLTKDGELPWGWLNQNKPIIKPYEDKMVQMAIDLKNYNGKDRIRPLEELIAFYADFKSFCYQKNECYKKYFSDMWEHCHNSRNNDFEYITQFVEELNELKGQK